MREALQLLRGEGFVIFSPNRGARVRPIDQDFVRDIYEIGVLIEPALTRWFVGMATDEDIAELERIQGLIEENNFADPLMHSELDTAFHTVMYQRHYNRHAAELWWKHREVLRAVEPALQFHAGAARRRSSASIANSSHSSRPEMPTRRPSSSPATSKDPAGTSSSRCGRCNAARAG